ncbi:hypothetical protein D9613_003764 [Agrocybe pediades]|uniref:F-box domain-containing protein n=1 Tax=Agrocybe pediades TaxID=84607 RepID=A0A8H4QKB5_9AGAR|nr:hypothetical protein D9613_003764 [Agrocybe pediades]
MHYKNVGSGFVVFAETCNCKTQKPQSERPTFILLSTRVPHIQHLSSVSRSDMGQIMSNTAHWRPFRRSYEAIVGRLYSSYKHYRAAFLKLEGEDVVQPDVPATSLDDLPTELILHIFSFLELKPYIISHGVCRRWQELLPAANIHPVRRRLFKLFKQMLSCPDFVRTRTWTLNNLQDFDRQAYIDALLSQYPYIPEDFRLWILEWPAKMAISCVWPGLRHVYSHLTKFDQPIGVNWLSYQKECPKLLALAYKQGTPGARFIPGHLIWKGCFETVWLIFEKDDSAPGLFGSVLILDEYEEDSAVFPEQWQISSDVEYRYDGLGVERSELLGGFQPYWSNLFPNWVNYQEHRWDFWLRCIVMSPKFRPPEAPCPDWDIPLPVPMEFSSWMDATLPAPPWTSRDEPTYQINLLE